MKQSEKLDLILKALYEYKNSNKYISINEICEVVGIPIEGSNKLEKAIEIMRLTQRLEEDNLIKASITYNECSALLTSHGVDYCEESSYSLSGHPIIGSQFNISIINSPGSAVVSQSSNVSITLNIETAQKAINKISEIVQTETSLNPNLTKEILECLKEIDENLKNGGKPKFAIRSLLEIAGGISSIASWVTVLGQFAGIIPIPK